jgi:adenylate cyclase
MLSRERVERRLAAVLAADNEGYSRLVGVDEARILPVAEIMRRLVTETEAALSRAVDFR